jgi:hypothetical protein
MTLVALTDSMQTPLASLGSSYSDPAMQESLFHAAEQHVAAHQARIFDLLAIQLHNLNTAQDAPSRKDAIEKLQQIHQLLSQDPRASAYVKTQALWQICQQRISNMQSIQPTSAPSLLSRASHYAHRSFEWLKTHPLIPIAIAGVVAAGYMTYAYLNRTPPLSPINPDHLPKSVQDALSHSCHEAVIGYKGLQESDLHEAPFVQIAHQFQIHCRSPLTEQGRTKARLWESAQFTPTEYVPYPMSKIVEFVRPYLAGYCAQRQSMGLDCDTIQFHTDFWT